ncbi:Gfo/Idh/MocA family oxidoreductase [Pseudofrankia sp. DC12]|uniref:Gfo/Idh/MocA family oxidoreductase n=1 Tax=Pseudofrankia sp. DC12 TaxID=683315 RepID=UPI0005F811C8|nr:Gfo/Idh/MocA family oxidoreductase [Pseudofrankia sp. DC12]
MTHRPLGLGLIGLGLAGGVMAAAARTHPGVQLVGAAEPSPELRRRFEAGEGLPTYADIDGLLTRPEVDAVYVATPHQLHREHTLAAAAAGKHVIVEKPMALDAAHCDEMIAAAAAAGTMLVVGHTHGFDPAVLVIRDLVASGSYGPLGMVALWNYTDFLYRPRRPEELDSARGGGILYNQVPHQIDVARTIAAQPVRAVRAVASVLDPARPVEGACAALVEFADHGAASLVYSGYDHFDSDELHGWVAEGGGRRSPAHGSARRALRGMSASAEARARARHLGYGARPAVPPAHQPHFGELVVTCAHADFRCGTDEVTAYTERGVERVAVPGRPWWPGRGDVLQELVDAVVHGRPAFHDGSFGRETVRTALAIAQSARERREVLLDPREVTAPHERVH